MEGTSIKEVVKRCLDDDPNQRPSIQEISQTQLIKSLKVRESHYVVVIIQSHTYVATAFCLYYVWYC